MKRELRAALAAFISAGILFSAGIFILYSYANPAVMTAGIILDITGLFSFLILMGKPFSRLVPVMVRKLLLMNILLVIATPIAWLLGVNRENTINYFLGVNNRMNPENISGNILLLLPRCIQDSQCTRQLSNDINNCAGCCKCQVSDII